MKLAVVLFNLGGPDSLDAVEPFLQNLFADPAVISLPKVLRLPLARILARRRARIAKTIYKKIGGRSPILDQTEAQAGALEKELSVRGMETKVFVAMRAWRPFARETAQAVLSWKADHIVLLPLYPQFSTTTTASSVHDWDEARCAAGLNTPQSRVCCYPWLEGFAAAQANLIQGSLVERRGPVDYRLLLSAHGLPKRTIFKGDPYQWQVEKTAVAILDKLGIAELDWQLCYQSRVGPLEWIGPSTDSEIRRAGRDGKGVVVAPIAFVSEHSETLAELDIEFAQLARDCGVPHYLRVPAVGTAALFISALADMVIRAAKTETVVTCGGGRICPVEFGRCGYGGGDA